jgi:hypothetical protein
MRTSLLLISICCIISLSACKNTRSAIQTAPVVQSDTLAHDTTVKKQDPMRIEHPAPNQAEIDSIKKEKGKKKKQENFQE